MAYIDLPRDVCDQCCGLALDLGGSVTKIAYRAKDGDVRDDESPVEDGKARIRLVLSKLSDLEDTLRHLAGQIHYGLAEDDGKVTVPVTGVSLNGREAVIQEILNVKVKSLSEFNCSLKGFTLCTETLSMDELFYPFPKEGWQEGMHAARTLHKLTRDMDQASKIKFSLNDPTKFALPEHTDAKGDTVERESLFPCLLAILGSATVLYEVKDSRTMRFLYSNARGSKSFLGIGRLLTGTSSYDELVALAEAGDDGDISEYFADLQGRDEEDDSWYGQMDSPGDDVLYQCFGKANCPESGKFRKEDLARALVHQYTSDLADQTHMYAQLTGSRAIVFAGNFTRAEIIRKELTKYLVRRKVFQRTKENISVHFLRNGGFLVAVGALVST